MKRIDIGGQAVIEGVMMKGRDSYAIAVRKPDKEIVLDRKAYASWSKRHKVLGLPILRGAVAFLEAMVLGTKMITYSAEFFEVEEEVKKTKFDHWMDKKFGSRANDALVGISVVLAMALAFLLFFLLPLGVSQLLREHLTNPRMMNLVDGLVRILILFLYILAISRMKDIQRVFQYHGAEHKSINCVENGLDLTVENVLSQSRLHKRCGTSFLLYVVVVSVFILTIINVQTFWMRLLVRFLCFPLIAGISYEIIKLMGRFDTKAADFLSGPGMLLQRLTTKEPDAEQVAVAIAALQGVMDDERETQDRT
ncbi:DUF1385 domain-containing protein [Anaerotalea alkaliphila]|uniref:DUF1385 domain-containing protein n=1 Tax=Anaerotalea alkaliphila TaxID=2662126 RepID=A0A7X5HY72_9FIRM|nr:DUF1385 domain-containing protein [Anaerotalea alkaliphila]NDL68829.1 DUF1385 domain-containing protein [Anaerotalea alkaliphila]